MLAGLFVAFGGNSVAQIAPPQLNVTGPAEIKVVPDEIDMQLGVESRHSTLSEAKRENDERVSRAL